MRAQRCLEFRPDLRFGSSDNYKIKLTFCNYSFSLCFNNICQNKKIGCLLIFLCPYLIMSPVKDKAMFSVKIYWLFFENMHPFLKYRQEQLFIYLCTVFIFTIQRCKNIIILNVKYDSC